MHIESIGYLATAPGAGAAAAAAAGDSLQIRNARQGSRVLVLGLIADNQVAGFHQLIWPTAHDTTRNIRVRVPIGEPYNRFAPGSVTDIKPQELIAATIAGSAVAGDIENGAIVVWYEDFPGISARLLDESQLRAGTVRLVTVDLSITTGAGGGWTGAEAINAESDLLRANTDYAVLGALIGVQCCAIGVRAPDWGNVRIPIPGHASDARMTAGFLTDLSREAGVPCIPVFNSANRASVLIDALQDENAAAVTASLMLAELRS